MSKPFTLPELYRAARLPRSGAWIPASAALIRARANGAAYAAAVAAVDAARAYDPAPERAAMAEQLAAARAELAAATAAQDSIDWQDSGWSLAIGRARVAREKAAEFESAARRLQSPEHKRDLIRKAEAERARAWRLCYTSRKLGKVGPSMGMGHPFTSGGWTLQWAEIPGSAFRFCGLASDMLGPRAALGYYMDSDDMGETARGVVYQLAPRNGRARYVPAVADPFNSEKDGSGPAMLGLQYVQEAEGSAEDQAEAARISAARMADSMAESYAEAEREYQKEYRAGQEAREKAEGATAAGAAYVAAIRALRGLWQARHGLGSLGIAPSDGAALIRAKVAAIRAACQDWQEARKEAAEARPYRLSRAAEAFRAGYCDGAL